MGPQRTCLVKETVCYFLVMDSFSILIGRSTSHRSQKPRPLHPKAVPMVPQAGQHQGLQVPAVEQPAMVWCSWCIFREKLEGKSHVFSPTCLFCWFCCPLVQCHQTPIENQLELMLRFSIPMVSMTKLSQWTAPLCRTGCYAYHIL